MIPFIINERCVNTTILQLNYTNWKPGEPYLETEDCVNMIVKDGKWDNHRCSKKNPYICQQKQREYNVLLL